MQTKLNLIFLLSFGLIFMCHCVPQSSYGIPRKCPIYETYYSCGANCQTECATLGKPCNIQYIRCPDGCYCNEGYARNAQGTCIPIKDCSSSSGGAYY